MMPLTNQVQQTEPATMEEKLARLCVAIGCKDRTREALEVFRDMWAICGLRSYDAEPRWSGLTDDSTPTEFSVVFTASASPRLRVLFEPQADLACPSTYWDAGRRVTRYLRERWGATIDQALAIEDLFTPDDPNMNICMGHAFELEEGGPAFKMYYNAMAHGPEAAIDMVDAAFRRLGNTRAWNMLRRRFREGDRIELFALDLTPASRLKLYVRPIAADFEHLIDLYTASKTAAASDVREMWNILAKPRTPETSRPVFLTYQFNDPDDDRPTRTALSIPTFPGLPSDLAALRRTCRVLRRFGLPTLPYTCCVRAMADRPLSKEEGIHSYIAIQRNQRDVAVVAYLNPRLYFHRYGWLARDPIRTWPTAVTASD